MARRRTKEKTRQRLLDWSIGEQPASFRHVFNPFCTLFEPIGASAWQLQLSMLGHNQTSWVEASQFLFDLLSEDLQMVSRDQLMDNWSDLVGSVKAKFGDFTKDELARVEGNFEQLVGLVQRKTGQSREHIASFLNACSNSAGSTYNQVVSRASHLGDAAGEAIRENYDRVASEAKRGLDFTAQHVNRRPFESLFLAIGAGVVAGVLVGISISSRKR